jgi:hypothetical protein
VEELALDAHESRMRIFGTEGHRPSGAVSTAAVKQR